MWELQNNMLCGMAAGMAKAGLKPVVPIYSSFYQRGYDQVIHDICIQELPVVLGVDRAGIVGNDGETHQGILDLSFFQIVPNLTIMAPKDFTELEDMLSFAFSLHRPVAIRYPRGGESKIPFYSHGKIELGKAELLQAGKDITIIAIGKMVSRAKEIATLLEQEGKEVELINARFLKPIDEEMLLSSIQKTKNVVTIEDNIVVGGLASSIQNIITTHRIPGVMMQCFGYPDTFIRHGKIEEIEKIYGMDTQSIFEAIKNRK